MYLPFAETETLTMKLMKRRILQVCLTCHWASEKIVIGRRNNMLVRINFYFFLPNSSLNITFARASFGGATRQRAADPPLPLPQLPAGQQWRLLLRPHHRQPRVLRLQAGLTRLQLHLSLGIAQAQARGEGREAGEDQGDHRLHLRLRHHQPSHGWEDLFFPSTDKLFDIHHPEEFTEALDRHKLKGMTEEQVTIAKDIR